jgi:hypothetical protein
MGFFWGNARKPQRPSHFKLVHLLCSLSMFMELLIQPGAVLGPKVQIPAPLFTFDLEQFLYVPIIRLT